MKKILFLLTAAMLTLTACQQRESFNFLMGESQIGLTFDYGQITYENAETQRQFEQILANRQDGLEIAFLADLNDELEDIWMRAYRLPAESVQVNYTFNVVITKVTNYGVKEAIVHVYDKSGRDQKTFTLRTRQDFEYSFTESVFDSMEDLGDYLGEQIRLGM